MYITRKRLILIQILGSLVRCLVFPLRPPSGSFFSSAFQRPSSVLPRLWSLFCPMFSRWYPLPDGILRHGAHMRCIISEQPGSQELVARSPNLKEMSLSRQTSQDSEGDPRCLSTIPPDPRNIWTQERNTIPMRTPRRDPTSSHPCPGQGWAAILSLLHQFSARPRRRHPQDPSWFESIVEIR